MVDPARTLDAVVIGAGPAGIGTALALRAVEGLTVGVIERGRTGQNFLDWPERQTFLLAVTAVALTGTRSSRRRSCSGCSSSFRT